MRILVEILHPAHVHFFRNAIAEWKARGDEVLVLSREKDVANQLLTAYGIPFQSLSKLGTKKWQLAVEMLQRDVKMYSQARRFSPDLLVGIMGVTIVQVARLIRRPAIVFYDTENANVTNRFVYPLAHSVCTPECYQGHINGTHVKYPGYHELAYLHPKRFQPDPEIVRAHGVNPDEPYFIVRFVSWQASHDLGEKGFDLSLKKKLVETLAAHGRVLISSEGPLPQEFESYRFRAAPEHLHHFIAFCTTLVGESATMASEAAVLGVPAFYIADTGRGYTDEQQRRYGLVENFTLEHAGDALERLQELLATPDLRALGHEKRERLLSERIDTTAWMMSYIDSVVKQSR